MHFDLTITLGNLITLAGTIISLMLVAWRLFARLQEVEWKLDLIWRWYSREHDIGNGQERKRKDRHDKSTQ